MIFRGEEMAGFVIIGGLAAFGLLCMLWMIYGMCCGKCEGKLLIVSAEGKGLLRRCLWLKEMGLLDCPMEVCIREIDPMDAVWLQMHGIEIWMPGQIGAGTETGAKEHGAGTGNSPGCHQRGGVPEL